MSTWRWALIVALLGAVGGCSSGEDSSAPADGGGAPVSREDVVKVLATSGLAVCSVVEAEPTDSIDALVTLRESAEACNAPLHQQTPPELHVGLIHQTNPPLLEGEARAATFRECQLVATMGDWLIEAGNACVSASRTTSPALVDRALVALRDAPRVRVWPSPPG